MIFSDHWKAFSNCSIWRGKTQGLEGDCWRIQYSVGFF